MLGPYSTTVNHAPTSANATFAATLCDQLGRDGLTAAFVAPGSRSTPMALALIEHGDISVEIFHDERSAAFAALGHGLATGRPGLVLCSSGTAGAHFYAAVIEADASAVPMIVVTADRPPELWNRGAPQTIDQTELYGTVVRDFVEPGPPDDLDPGEWRFIARRLWNGAAGPVPGPVHANLSFRDPLTGTPDTLPDALAAVEVSAPPSPHRQAMAPVADALGVSRGVIIVGRTQSEPTDVFMLANELGWPILADHRSGCRIDSSMVIRHFDALLRDDGFTRDHRPDVVLRIGEIVSSKAVSLWLSASAAAGAKVVSSSPHGRLIDPESVASLHFEEAGAVEYLLDMVEPDPDDSWLPSWSAADRVAEHAIATTLASAGPNEVSIAQEVCAGAPSGAALMVSSSMPVRDVEWYGPKRDDVDVFANRGANGIDGIVATAVGIALSGQPTICLIGDVAFLHDATSLTALRHRPVDLTIVVVDNDGGGIFSFLPQHQMLDAPAYERLFGTPHGTDLARLVEAHGIAVEPWTGSIASPDGVRVLLARTERSANLVLHDDLNAAVAHALADRRER